MCLVSFEIIPDPASKKVSVLSVHCNATTKIRTRLTIMKFLWRSVSGITIFISYNLCQFHGALEPIIQVLPLIAVILWLNWALPYDIQDVDLGLFVPSGINLSFYASLLRATLPLFNPMLLPILQVQQLKSEGKLGSDSRSTSQSVCSLDKFEREEPVNSRQVGVAVIKCMQLWTDVRAV